jgi:hypothetical protein
MLRLLAVHLLMSLTAASPAAAAIRGANLVDVSNAHEQLAAEKRVQLERIKSSRVFHDFQFTDAWQESGIRFEHRVVDDAGKYYKPVHYDHGNGLALADVDGDHLPDLYFTTQLGENQLWRNSGGGAFENITGTAGVGLKDKVSVAAAFADVDNDGDPDLFVTTVRGGNHLFENRGDGRFRDVTESAGVGYVGHSSGAVFFDYDRDGFLDLFLCNVGVYTSDRKGAGGYYVGLRDGFSGHMYPGRTEYSILYRNTGNVRFEDVSAEVGLRDPGWTGDAIFTDLNQDLFPDLYVLNMQGDDHFYENQGGKRFVETAARYFPKTPWGSMGAGFFDFNQDGLMDLFVTDMHSDMTEAATRASKTNMSPAFALLKSDPWCTTEFSESYLQGAANNIFGNAFYLNQGAGSFQEVSGRVHAETFWPWGLSIADLNADTYQDVFVTAGMGFGFRYGINSVLLNDRGERFISAEFALGVEPRAENRIQKVAFVLECSGADRDHPLCNGRSGRLPVYEALSSRSSAICDLDDDGDLDIVTLEMNDRPQVLLSNLASRHPPRFLKIRLAGTTSNRDGLGATVKVTLRDRSLTQYHDGKLGYFAQGSVPLYFGLGDSGEPVSVEVLWPSGKKQMLSKPQSNRWLTITEPQS